MAADAGALQPDMGDPESLVEAVRARCAAHVAGWAGGEVKVKPLSDGLTNQLFKCQCGGQPAALLFRIFGKDNDILFSQAGEQAIFRALARCGVGPQVLAEGPGWRCEQWHDAVPIKVHQLRNPSVMAQTATIIARIHRLQRRDDFATGLPTEPATLRRCAQWADLAERAAPKSAALRARAAELRVAEMAAEARGWLPAYLTRDLGQGVPEPLAPGSGLDVVFCHNDVQENNLLQAPYGLRIIDFEYAGFNYQAFDLANLFCEASLDYCHPEHPFFKWEPADYPVPGLRELAASVYLSEYLGEAVLPSDARVAVLEARVEQFTLASHLLWGLWGLIRADNSEDEAGFDFVAYAGARFEAYRRKKSELLQKGEKGPGAGKAATTPQRAGRRRRAGGGRAAGARRPADSSSSRPAVREPSAETWH